MTRKRVALLALSALCLTLTATCLAQARSGTMGPSVFNWAAIEEKPTSTGSVRKFFQAPTAMLQELECHVTTLNPGEKPHSAHRHPEEELIIIKEGTVEVLSSGELKRVGPGSVIFAAANQMHSIRNVGETPATYHIVKWKTPAVNAAD